MQKRHKVASIRTNTYGDSRDKGGLQFCTKDEGSALKEELIARPEAGSTEFFDLYWSTHPANYSYPETYTPKKLLPAPAYRVSDGVPEEWRVLLSPYVNYGL